MKFNFRLSPPEILGQSLSKSLPWVMISCLFLALQPLVSQESTPRNSEHANTAEIYLFRPKNPPAALSLAVKLDGTEIGSLFVRRYAVIHVVPGRHKIQVAGGMEFRHPSVELECEAGKRYYVSYTSLLGVGAILPVSPYATFSISKEMHWVPEDVGRKHVNRFALAFVHGREWPADIPGIADIIDVPDGKTLPQLRDIILAAAQKYNWTIQQDTLGKIIIHQANKRWNCTFVIIYDTSKIYIHSDSTVSGKKAVPPGWIASLKASLLKALEAQ